MRIRIDANPLGPLKVISEFPDAQVALLEGLNGIGKTLAVRLLQICTGEVPYASDSPAWASLCQGLGEFVIAANGLRGADEITWKADSRDWAYGRTSTEFPAFRSVTIDGHDASIDEVRRLLLVYRVGGDEGIVETLAQQAEVGAERLRRWAQRHTAAEGSPLARLEGRIGQAIDSFGDVTAERFGELQKLASEADARRADAGKTLELATRAREALAEIAQMRRALRDLESIAPDLLQRIDNVDSTIETLRKERDRIQHEMMTLAGTVANAEPVLRELKNARRTLDRNRSELSKSLNEAAALAAELGIEPTRSSVGTLITDLERRAAALREEQNALDAAPAMRHLLDGLAGELVDAEGQGLAEQVAIDDPETDVQLTVAQTRTGMQARRSYLEGQPPPPQAREVADQLATVQRLLPRALRARDVLAAVDRHRRLVGQNEERVDRALRATDPSAVAKLQALEGERRKRDEELLGLAAERASLRQQLGAVSGGETAEQLEFRLSHAAQEVGVALEHLDEAITNADSRVAEAGAALARADEQAVGARRELARALADLRRVSGLIVNGEELAWLRRALSAGSLPEVDMPPAQQLLALDSIHERLVTTSERFGRHRTQIAAVEGALRGVARHLRGDDPQTVEYLEELQRSFGDRFSAWFNNEIVRRELLPEAEGPVSVDLKKRNVEWTTGGTLHFRPLEAFSSGEQAFAYTRARLAVLDEERPRPANRLIVLDEFGAFIAHDRLDGLLAYIRERSGEHAEDQVLVILPLNRDYEQMSLNTVGAESTRLRELADEIKKRKFAVQVLSK